jgi:hypothetical protein
LSEGFTINHFRNKYPLLWHYCLALAGKEVEKANIEGIRQRAKKCDNDSLIKLVFLDSQAIWEDFVRDKRCRLIEEVRKSAGLKSKNTNYLSSLNRAEIGLNPFRGRQQKINVSRSDLTREFIKTVIEIQKLKAEIDCKHGRKEIFKKGSEFLNVVKQLEQHDKTDKKEQEIIENVEEKLVAALCNQQPTKFAINILADEYFVDDETIRKKLLPGAVKKLKKQYPHIPSEQSYIEKLIEESVRQIPQGKKP